MGGRPGCNGAKEHIACPDLPYFKGLVATRTMADESLKRGLAQTRGSCTVTLQLSQ